MLEQDNKKIINNLNNLSKLQWACRRGMLELDVLLGNFLKEAYSHLDIHDKKCFVSLLEYADPDLFEWLLGHSLPDEVGLIDIIQKIRRHAHS